MSVEEKNKGLVREFFGEAWGKGNMAAVDEYMAADYVEHPRPSNLPAGTEGLKQLIAAYRTAFVTCLYAILDPKSGTLSYANAGHDLPYLSHGGDAEELRATGMPLGLMPEMGYEEKVAVLREEDSVLFYSDGLVEAHDPLYEMFGFPRFRVLISEHGKQRKLVDSLLEELYSFVGEGWEQEDDITLVTLRCSALLS